MDKWFLTKVVYGECLILFLLKMTIYILSFTEVLKYFKTQKNIFLNGVD